jgi:type VI protein secretion system component VasF
MNDKEIKDWTRISVWTLRLIVALAFLVAYLIITGKIDLWLG